jgi:hypothetical protein
MRYLAVIVLCCLPVTALAGQPLPTGAVAEPVTQLTPAVWVQQQYAVPQPPPSADSAQFKRDRKEWYIGSAIDIGGYAAAGYSGKGQEWNVSRIGKTPTGVVLVSTGLTISAERLATWAHRRQPLNPWPGRVMRWGGRARIGLGVIGFAIALR